MRVMLISLLPVFMAAGLNAGHLYKEKAEMTLHADGRTSPRMIVNPRAPRVNSLADVKAYVKSLSKSLKLPANIDNLVHARTKESLLGTHYTFQQIENGVPVNEGEIIVSVEHGTGRIYHVFNNTFPVDAQKIYVKSALSKGAALDIAWKNLKVHGSLMAASEAKLQYRSINGKIRLVYVTTIAATAPFGYFEQIIDAQSGKILSKRDAGLSRNKRASWPSYIEAYSGPIADRKISERDFAMRSRSLEDEAPTTQVDGQCLIFDPDPRTVLNNRDLEDDSDPALFEAAYKNEVLKDIAYNGTEYRLKGPWVEIADMEAPRTPPSKSTTGNWTSKRGNNAFNDVMTYFHIDKNQRYMQSLGFKESRGIQYGPIKIDSDGLQGDDNSHYIPYNNTIAFGHGCVDDNEDADVILHEFGHAIQQSINANWNGGDTGAMGEGFGDYWAGSYSVRNPQGKAYFPNEVFSWDGQGSDGCWPGRVLDALGARYNERNHYGAHSPITGGFQSDELWSTPLFQSLRQLTELGYPPEDSDSIVLESHFGLGGGLTMRELANHTVRTARALYPNGPHGDIFLKNFLHHNIIDLPKAVLSIGAFSLDQAGTNGYADPGELVNLYVPIINNGTLSASLVKAELSTTTPGVEIVQATSDYGDIGQNSSQANLEPFTLALAKDLPCGTNIDLVLRLTFAGGTINDAVIEFSIPTGKALPDPGVFSVAQELSIPDNDPHGVQSALLVSGTNSVVIAKGLSVDVDIKHSFIGDLKITLISPQGIRVLLHHSSGGSADDLVGNFPATLTSETTFDILEGVPFDGEWKLEVVDQTSVDTGALNSWGLRAVFDRQCE